MNIESLVLKTASTSTSFKMDKGVKDRLHQLADRADIIFLRVSLL